MGKPIDLLSTEFEKIEQYRQQDHIASYESAVQYLCRQNPDDNGI
jgi:hypothetical protein